MEIKIYLLIGNILNIKFNINLPHNIFHYFVIVIFYRGFGKQGYQCQCKYQHLFIVYNNDDLTFSLIHYRINK